MDIYKFKQNIILGIVGAILYLFFNYVSGFGQVIAFFVACCITLRFSETQLYKNLLSKMKNQIPSQKEVFISRRQLYQSISWYLLIFSISALTFFVFVDDTYAGFVIYKKLTIASLAFLMLAIGYLIDLSMLLRR